MRVSIPQLIDSENVNIERFEKMIKLKRANHVTFEIMMVYSMLTRVNSANQRLLIGSLCVNAENNTADLSFVSSVRHITSMLKRMCDEIYFTNNLTACINAIDVCKEDFAGSNVLPRLVSIHFKNKRVHHIRLFGQVFYMFKHSFIRLSEYTASITSGRLKESGSAACLHFYLRSYASPGKVFGGFGCLSTFTNEKKQNSFNENGEMQ